MNFLPSLTDRACIIGMTGSGKTTLAKAILQTRPYVVIHDAKGLIQIDGFARYTNLLQCQQSKYAKIIYAPNHKELRDSIIIESFFHWIYDRQNTTLYVDEVYSVTNRGEIPDYYHAILTRGREMNISCISSTQRPKLIPQSILSESDLYYVFRLLLPQDRQKIRDILPLSNEKLTALKRHEFFFGSADGVIMGPLKLGGIK